MSDLDKTVEGITTILQKELQDLFDSLTDEREALAKARKNIDLYDERINEAHEKIEEYEGKIDSAEMKIREWVESGAKGSPSESKRVVRDFKRKIEDEKDLIETLTDARKEMVRSIQPSSEDGGFGGLIYELSSAFHVNLRGIKAHLEQKFNEYIQLANEMQVVWSNEVTAFTQANDLSVIHPDYSSADREEQMLLVPRKPQGVVGQWVQALVNAITDSGLTMDQLRAEAEKEKALDAVAADKLTKVESEDTDE